MKHEDLIPIGAAFVGALAQELLHWHGLRMTLESARYRRLFGSSSFWVVSVGMVLLSTLGAWIWYSDASRRYVPRDYLLAGAAFPLILKKATMAMSPGQKVVLGEVDDEPAKKWVLNDYFGI